MTIVVILCISALLMCFIFSTRDSIHLHKEIMYYSKLAQKNFGITHNDFIKYWVGIRAIKGKSATPMDAYNMAKEEWYDLNYK